MYATEYDVVDLIASGYEWVCPICDHLNNVIEVTEQVNCQRCFNTFEVQEHEHAYD